MLRRAVRAAAALALLAPFVLGVAGGSAPAFAEEVVCEIADDRLVEISGMALSPQHPDVVWMHNDSSGGPLLYAVSVKTCETIATLTVSGTDARDYEAIAIGKNRNGRDVIWLADIGDNRDSWPYVELVRIREPRTLRDRTVTGRVFRFTYEDGPRDAEALLAHGTQLWVVSKKIASGSIYQLPDPLKRGTVNIATRIGEAEGLVTDGSMAPDGSRYALRDYWSAWIYAGLPVGEQVAELPLPAQPQGEAMTWTADGRALLIASEGDRRLIRVPVGLPASTPSAGADESDVDDASTEPAADASGAMTGALVVAALVGAGAVLVVAEWRRRSH